MPDLKLSLPERALLLILMAENTELSNPQIEKKYAPGLKLTGKNRQRLVDEKLIECRKGARNAYFFTLAEEGWHWCRQELTRAVPPNSGSAGHALYAVLGGLDRYLDSSGRSLAQVFGGQPELEQPKIIAGPPSPAASSTADEIEQAIRRAYRKLADPAGSWVGLADIRQELNGIPKREIDGVLRLMTRMQGVQIEEETNQKALEQRDRDAAVRIGSRDQHVLAIAP
ncbi:hypothetical protein GCM10010399_33940 [Dactylosporangium fulvum]|uniref:MarR family transcriptional regulator n=1 Tax=Dactylosporangium fulvum TaxID=53359 RepID=A0ABY5VZG2_9ACTN|nr:hypothetical protein [Dactylosporangium fulvum]UWP83198.1 hypothetical protein Dfulv_02495 [Dactylosporangium fulvum]